MSERVNECSPSRPCYRDDTMRVTVDWLQEHKETVMNSGDIAWASRWASEHLINSVRLVRLTSGTHVLQQRDDYGVVRVGLFTRGDVRKFCEALGIDFSSR